MSLIALAVAHRVQDRIPEKLVLSILLSSAEDVMPQVKMYLVDPSALECTSV